MKMKRALAAWGVQYHTTRGDLQSAGSPERCLERAVVEGADGNLYFVESIAEATAPRKREMARLMRALSDEGVPVSAPLLSRSGETLVKDDGTLWQLTPFVQGAHLERPGYTAEAWRGHALGGFLTALRAASGTLDSTCTGREFDLPGYIDALTLTIAKRRPKVAHALTEATAFLKAHLYPHWGTLPVALAHGDIHAINVLWKERGIASVIDWEFFGQKPMLYDVANMAGCCGMESPDALLNGLTPALIQTLKGSGFADATSWSLLPECIMALRYAWLSEWLRKDDTEMINLELQYIYLLMDNRETLVRAWG